MALELQEAQEGKENEPVRQLLSKLEIDGVKLDVDDYNSLIHVQRNFKDAYAVYLRMRLAQKGPSPDQKTFEALLGKAGAFVTDPRRSFLIACRLLKIAQRYSIVYDGHILEAFIRSATIPELAKHIRNDEGDAAPEAKLRAIIRHWSKKWERTIFGSINEEIRTSN